MAGRTGVRRHKVDKVSWPQSYGGLKAPVQANVAFDFFIVIEMGSYWKENLSK